MSVSDSTTEIYSIGFTKKGARKFFSLLNEANIERLVDVRIRNRSQLSGFAKRDDLEYFLEELLGATYEHEPRLAPTEELLDDWRNDDISWEEYEERFYQLLNERNVEEHLDEGSFSRNTVLLCSEHEPEHCHRRLVLEYLSQYWENIEAIHLGD